MAPAEWLGENRGQIESIIRVVCRGYRWPDYEILNDLVSRVITSLLRRRVLERYDKSKGSWRTYLWTCIIRELERYKRHENTKGRQHVSISYDDSWRTPAADWTEESDAAIDIRRWHAAWAATASANARRILALLMEGYNMSEAARKLGMSRERVRQIQDKAHGHYEQWAGNGMLSAR